MNTYEMLICLTSNLLPWPADPIFQNQLGNKWNVPVGLFGAKTIKIGRVPFNIRVGLEYSVVSQDDFGKRAQFRFQITPVIPGLIEIGVDVIEPVQPNYMDPAALKRRYGDTLSFWGGVGTPTLWAHGSPRDIKDEVKRRIDELGPGGGYVCGNAFDLEPWTPWENIVAFSEAVEEYGHYRA